MCIALCVAGGGVAKMESRFDRAVQVVLMHEGRYADDPTDPGGTTKYGISLRLLRQLGYDLDNDLDIDADDVRMLTLEQAKKIYRTKWWDKYRYGEIQDLELAVKIFDLSVNIGPTQAHKLLQRALHAAGYRHVQVDGILGPQTLTAVNDAEPRLVLGALRAEAAWYYRSLVTERPELSQFLNGWLNRAYS